MTSTDVAAPPRFSVVIPCYNEEDAVEDTVRHVFETIDDAGGFEVVVIDDGSTDRTGERLEGLLHVYPHLQVVRHDRNRGYGAALKTGIQRCRAPLIVITDADGTYPNERICELVARCADQDMVVGARTADSVRYPWIRRIPKVFLRRWASWIANQDIPDINSGLRVFRRDTAESLLPILPNTFSFTTTITLAMLTTYRRVDYVPM